MMLYDHLTEDCFGRAGNVSRGDVDALLAKLQPAFDTLRQRGNPQATPLIDIARRTDDLGTIKNIAAEVNGKFRHIIVIGTGGSGLSGRTLTHLAPMAQGARFHYLDNIDPEPMVEMLQVCEPAQTFCLVISKSGGTVETLSQFYVVLEHMQRHLGDKAREHFAVITMPVASPMRASAQEHGLRLLDHATDIGGRFCILTNVGLLPAAIAGLDIAAVRKGAQSVIEQMEQAKHIGDCYPALGAALQVAFIRKGIPMTVMLPYSERLTMFSSWFRQCWSESLGKSGQGSTPIRAVGTTDQHSQLQLYLDGPKDKLLQMVMLDRAGTGPNIKLPNHPELDYLQGKTVGDVMDAEQRATFETLVGKGCPVRLFKLKRLDEASIGALLMHFTLEVIFTAALLGIDPFDQPAVEDGKQLARAYLRGKQ